MDDGEPDAEAEPASWTAPAWCSSFRRGSNRVASTATARVGEWMAPFNTIWVTTMRQQLPGVALGVSGGPRPVCPWLCMGMDAGQDTALLVSTCPMPAFPVPRELAGQSGAVAP
jgi:hypothetical protein